MSTIWFPNGLEGFAAGSVDWDGNTFDVVALTLDGTLTDTAIKAITGATNATPIVITVDSTSGWTTGDIVVIRGVGGNVSANGTYKITVVNGTTFSLQTMVDGLNVIGAAAYTSGGCVINLTLADFYDDINGAVIATGGISGDIGSKTNVDGLLDGADVTFTSLNGTAHAVVMRLDTGTDGTARNLVFNDGKILVTCAANAATSATTLYVEPLTNDLPDNAVMVFSNGVTAQLNGAHSAGARALTVDALPNAIVAGHTADVQATGTGIPFSTTNGNVTLQWAAAGIARL
jgi:hypothetical protein